MSSHRHPPRRISALPLAVGLLASCADLLDADFDRAQTGADAADDASHDSGGSGGGGGSADASADGASGGDGGCPPGTKLCGTTCRSTDDPGVGCDDPSCTPCDVADATAGCSAGKCAVVGCPANFGDCDTSAANGCEQDLRSASSDCGACGHDCLGGECEASACQPVVLLDAQKYPGFVAPWNLAVDDQYVFVTVTKYSSTGYVLRMKKDGSERAVLANEGEPYDIALDAGHVYWTNNVTSGGHVRKMAKDGSGGVVTLASGQAKAVGVSVDDGNVYWASSTNALGAVRRVPKTGGTAYDLAGSLARPRSTLSDSASGGFVFFVTAYDGKVQKAAKQTGALTEVAIGVTAPWALARDPGGSSLYFTTFIANGGVYAVDASATQAAASPLAQSQSPAPFYVHADDSYVYFTTHDVDALPNHVKRVKKSGGPVEVLAEANTPAGITSDATAVYWVEYGSDRVLKLAK